MAASPKNAYLYVMGHPSGPHKIGWAADVDQRKRGLVRKYGAVEHIHRAPISNGLALYAERYAHWLLRDHHFRHEWFNVSADVAVKAATEAAAIDFRTVGLIPAIPDRYTATRFPEGTLERIDAVLEDGEKRSDLIREAVERELKRRERKLGI